MFVYLIQNGSKKSIGAVKIGKANNVKKRLEELQIGNPVKLNLLLKIEYESEKQAYDAELSLHRLFAKKRIRGEWYKLELYDLPRISAYLKKPLIMAS